MNSPYSWKMRPQPLLWKTQLGKVTGRGLGDGLMNNSLAPRGESRLIGSYLVLLLYSKYANMSTKPDRLGYTKDYRVIYPFLHHLNKFTHKIIAINVWRTTKAESRPLPKFTCKAWQTCASTGRRVMPLILILLTPSPASSWFSPTDYQIWKYIIHIL